MSEDTEGARGEKRHLLVFLRGSCQGKRKYWSFISARKRVTPRERERKVEKEHGALAVHMA